MGVVFQTLPIKMHIQLAGTVCTVQVEDAGDSLRAVS